MSWIERMKYTLKERKQKRHNAAYSRLKCIIRSHPPDAVEFKHTLGEELATGFPIDWPDDRGRTLLHWTVYTPAAIRAGLPQVLIDADAAVNVKDDFGRTPLGETCWNHIWFGDPEYLAAIDMLLGAGAQIELEGKSFEAMPDTEERARRDWLDAYIKTWPERRARSRDKDVAPAFDYAL